jgi:hypothetical protein
MRTHMQLAAPVRLLALFVVISGVPLVALGWLGWRVLQQDRALETQRLRERLDGPVGGSSLTVGRRWAHTARRRVQE